MKKVFLLITCLVLIFNFTACFGVRLFSKDYLGFYKEDFSIIDESDSHSGPLGDGSYRLILDCSRNKEKAMENIKGWARLPLSENLNLIMYGGEKDGVSYGFDLAEDAKMPQISNGFYRFYDRHSKSTDSSDDSELFNRYSFNFSLAVYDTDTDILYYFEFDT